MSGHRILTGRTRVTGPGGRAYVLNVGDVLPEWAVGRVGEHLLQPEDESKETQVTEQPQGEQIQRVQDATTAPETLAPEVADEAGLPDGAELGATEVDGRGKASVDVPPKSGAGATTEAWAEYARANGVNVGDDAGRGDIIAALDAAGVPTDAD